MVISLRSVPEISPFEALRTLVAMFSQEFCRAGQVSGDDGLVGEIDVGHVFVEFSLLLTLQSAPSLPLRIMTKHLFILSPLFREVFGARGAPGLPKTCSGPANNRDENGGRCGKTDSMPPQRFPQTI